MKKILGFAMIAMLIATQAFAAITFTNTITSGPASVGGQMETTGELNLAGTYASGGFAVTGSMCGMSHIKSLMVQGEDGYSFWYNSGTAKVMVFQTGATAGSIANIFTGTPATISPTAVVTLTDNTPVVGYAVYYNPTSHTFNYNNSGTGTDNALVTVTGATYTPAGSVASVLTGASAGPLVEVTAGTSLASVDKVDYLCKGW